MTVGFEAREREDWGRRRQCGRSQGEGVGDRARSWLDRFIGVTLRLHGHDRAEVRLRCRGDCTAEMDDGGGVVAANARVTVVLILISPQAPPIEKALQPAFVLLGHVGGRYWDAGRGGCSCQSDSIQPRLCRMASTMANSPVLRSVRTDLWDDEHHSSMRVKAHGGGGPAQAAFTPSIVI